MTLPEELIVSSPVPFCVKVPPKESAVLSLVSSVRFESLVNVVSLLTLRLLQVRLLVEVKVPQLRERFEAEKTVELERFPLTLRLPVELVLIFERSKIEEVPVSSRLPFTVTFASVSMFKLSAANESEVPVGISGNVETLGILITALVSEAFGAVPPSQFVPFVQSLSVSPVQTKAPAAATVLVPEPVEVISPASGEFCVTIRPAFETEPVLPVRLPVEIFPVEPTLILRVVTVGSPVNKLIDVD